MYKINAAHVLLTVIMMNCAAGQSLIKDPEADYVRSTTFPDHLIPSSDEILRLDLDLYSKGKKTIFLSYRDFEDRSGHLWTAYIPEDGGYKRFDETVEGYLIQFREDGFYSFGKNVNAPVNGGLFVFYTGRGGAKIVHYDFKNGAVHNSHVRDIYYDIPQDIALERLF